MKVEQNRKLMTVEEVAELLQVKVSWVYSHAKSLGAYRLGKYLRFSLVRVLKQLDEPFSTNDDA